MRCGACDGRKGKSSSESPSCKRRSAQKREPQVITKLFTPVRASEIGPRCLRDWKQVVTEVIVVVLSADRFPPRVVTPAPSLGRIHRLIEGVLVLDLDEGFEELVVRRH